MSFYYTTSTSVGVLLGTTFSGSTNPTDAQVAQVIQWQSEYVNRYTGRIWSSATTSEYFDVKTDQRVTLSAQFGRWTDTTYFLRHFPVISVQAVRENTSRLSGENWVQRGEGYALDYLVYTDEGFIQFHRLFPMPARKNLWVSYTYGESPTPDDIAYATALLSANQIITTIKRTSDQQGLSDVSVGSAHYAFGDLENQRKAFYEMAHDILTARGRTVKSLPGYFQG